MIQALAEPISWRGSVLDLFRQTARGAHPFLLWSGTADEGRGRWSLMGSDPFRTWSAAGGEDDQEDPFTVVAELAAAYRVELLPSLPFAGGLVGYLGHECLRHVERVAVHPAVATDPPDAWFGLYASAVAVDHQEGQVWLVATGLPERDPSLRKECALRQLQSLRRRMAAPIPQPQHWEPQPGPLPSRLPERT